MSHEGKQQVRDLVDNELPVERHDVFNVMQLTRDTFLESLVAADLVVLDQGERSQVHRHNRADTVLYFLDGSADVLVGNFVVTVQAGDRLRIAKTVYHGVRTPNERVRFLSIQSPPILDKAANVYDLEPLEE